ncbi:hypothetical protein [Streptomyces sp. NPDC101776]|uniref:hypothetical protein n=1 Tax=Streptomyces sp. NPDC101776 TaxID=3366146 RepID=UPI0038286775
MGGDHGEGPALRAGAGVAGTGTYAKGGGWTNIVLDTHADYSVSDVDLYGKPGKTQTFTFTTRLGDPDPANDKAVITVHPDR